MVFRSLKPAAGLRFAAAAIFVVAAAGTASADPSAPATSRAGGMQTPTQPTANDASVGVPAEPATMSDNPEAMSPYAARVNGTAPVKPDGK